MQREEVNNFGKNALYQCLFLSSRKSRRLLLDIPAFLNFVWESGGGAAIDERSLTNRRARCRLMALAAIITSWKLNGAHGARSPPRLLRV